MKKKTEITSRTLCAALLCTALSLAACACAAGANPSDDPGSAATQDSTDASQQAQGIDQDSNAGQDTEAGSGGNNAQEAGSEADTGESSAPETNAEADTPDKDPETDITVSTFPSHIRIEMQHKEEDLTADDGTVLCTTSYVYPEVSIEGNDDAAKKINADIRSRVDSFLSNTEVEEWAKEGYAYNIEDGSEYPFLSYYDDMTFGGTKS